MLHIANPLSNVPARLRALLSLTIPCLALIGSIACAQPVAVRAGETGQGFLFAHGGTCYAVLPRHVSGGGFRAQIIAETGRSAAASLRAPFWDGMDLALGILSRGRELCEARLEDLAGPRTSLAQQAEAVLVLVGLDGVVERLPMEITEIRYLDLEARFSGTEKVEARQGMSGGFLLVEGVPVGMAIDTVGGETLRFMRVEEIHMNMTRLLSTQVTFGVTAPDPASETPAAADDTLALRLISASAVAAGPNAMAENLLVPGAAYVFDPKKGPAIIELAMEGASALSQVVVNSTPKAGEAVPRRLLIQVNASPEGGRWRTFWSGEVPPDGVLDTGARLATTARRLRLTISSAWAAGPVRIDSIAAR